MCDTNIMVVQGNWSLMREFGVLGCFDFGIYAKGDCDILPLGFDLVYRSSVQPSPNEAQNHRTQGHQAGFQGSKLRERA